MIKVARLRTMNKCKKIIIPVFILLFCFIFIYLNNRNINVKAATQTNYSVEEYTDDNYLLNSSKTIKDFADEVHNADMAALTMFIPTPKWCCIVIKFNSIV